MRADEQRYVEFGVPTGETNWLDGREYNKRKLLLCSTCFVMVWNLVVGEPVNKETLQKA